MRALVIFETIFGNTGEVALSIAQGLSHSAEVTVSNVCCASAEVEPEIDLVMVGGPTHVFSMSRYLSRHDAVGRHGVTEVPIGIRDWLNGLADGGHPQPFAAFDTRLDMPLVPGAASHAASRLARRKGFAVIDSKSFYVSGYEGPLIAGEIERAWEWGRRLGDQLAE